MPAGTESSAPAAASDLQTHFVSHPKQTGIKKPILWLCAISCGSLLTCFGHLGLEAQQDD